MAAGEISGAHALHPASIEAQTEGKAMFLRQLIGYSAAAIVGAGAMLSSVATAQATMLPAPHYANSSVRNVDCAVGAHIGPVGGCILGVDNAPPPVIVERRAVDVPAPVEADGCASKSMTRTDGMGNSETRTKTDC
jgi:hypothetical protein